MKWDRPCSFVAVAFLWSVIMLRRTETMPCHAAVLSVLGLIAATLPGHAAEVGKIGNQQVKADAAIQQINLPAAGPGIVFVTPEDGGTYTSPIGIDITFDAADGSVVDLDTLKVTVVSKTAIGVFDIDITEDVIAYATPEGIHAPEAEIPAGEHVVTVEIADSEQRVATRHLSITVREPGVLERRGAD